ncbi:hypothetical protein [Phaffia rhodozyma]|uniref:Uncharacterized protein n=1 Tax=Phaffia rhodozyma TaxID=264483 RepID=A0A0F7SX73_PHARH|nr:hypothetical protein [Phaffia rhodozyma]
MSSTLLSKSSRDKIENLPAYRSASSPVEYTMSQLPLHVNLPGNQAANFPKAFNPERALLYQRAMARSLPKKTFLSKCVTLAVFATVGAIAYHLLFIEDYGHDNVMFAEARKERLRQISLKRPLTAKEQAILDRPAIETHELVSDVSFSDLFRRMGQRFRDREEDRLARQDAYKRKIGLLDELDGTSAATVGTSDSGTGLNWQRYQRKSNVREALPEDVEWDKVKSLN